MAAEGEGPRRRAARGRRVGEAARCVREPSHRALGVHHSEEEGNVTRLFFFMPQVHALTSRISLIFFFIFKNRTLHGKKFSLDFFESPC